MGNGHDDRVLTVVPVTEPSFGRYLVPAMIYLAAALFGVIVGTRIGDGRREIERLGNLAADLSLRVDRLERVAGTRDVGDNLIVRMDRLEELAVLNWRLDRRDGKISGSVPASGLSSTWPGDARQEDSEGPAAENGE